MGVNPGLDTNEIRASVSVSTPRLILDGVEVSSVSELNAIDGVTASVAELNILDGVTATTEEINILDGVTATTDEINALDGVAGFPLAALTAGNKIVFAGYQATDASGTTTVDLTDAGFTTVTCVAVGLADAPAATCAFATGSFADDTLTINTYGGDYAAATTASHVWYLVIGS